MGEHTSKQPVASEKSRSTLRELIHAAVRSAVEAAVEAELAATFGAGRYERRDSRQGYRNGTTTRTLSGPTGVLMLPCMKPAGRVKSPFDPSLWN